MEINDDSFFFYLSVCVYVKDYQGVDKLTQSFKKIASLTISQAIEDFLNPLVPPYIKKKCKKYYCIVRNTFHLRDGDAI